MTDNEMLMETFENRAVRRDNRRAFFKVAMGAAAVGAGAFLVSTPAAAQTVTDADVLNFALNLEYLEANFYYYAAFGTPIPAASQGTRTLTADQAATETRLNAGARAVTFTSPAVRAYAREIAAEELAHVNFLRTALGGAAVTQPLLDVGITPTGAFSSAARAAGLLNPAPATGAPTDFFDAYASDLSFLYAAFIFEDVGVTAYKGASPLLTNKDYLDAAAGILAAEAYHAAIVRTTIDQMGGMPGLKASTIRGDTELVSGARDSLDGSSDLDQGLAQGQSTLIPGVLSNIVPTNDAGQAFSRSTGQVLNIVYLNSAAVSAGGFFPLGVNGTIRSSVNSAPAA